MHRSLVCAPALLLLALTGCSGEDATGPQVLPTSSEVAATTPAPELTTSPPPVITVPTVTTTPTPSASSTATPSASATEEAPEDPLASQSPLETAPPTGQPACDSKDLTVVDADSITSSTSVQELFVVRTTGPDCQLSGYPTVQLRDPQGAVLPATYRPGGFGLPAERPVPHAISRGTSISFVVASGRTSATSASCPRAATIRVRLPGTTAALTTATSFAVCDRAVGLSPIRRQTGFE